jgi:hypothetical protein
LLVIFRFECMSRIENQNLALRKYFTHLANLLWCNGIRIGIYSEDYLSNMFKIAGSLGDILMYLGKEFKVNEVFNMNESSLSEFRLIYVDYDINSIEYLQQIAIPAIKYEDSSNLDFFHLKSYLL